MDHADAQDWLDRYVVAWRSNDPDRIAGLFSDDCTYRFHPYDAPVKGRDAVVKAWLSEPDDPESWEARYIPYMVEGNRIAATGTSRYYARDGRPERIYHNCFLIELDEEDRCRSFTEYYLREPDH